MSSKPDLKDINGFELDRRVWAYDEERRIAEIALKGRLEGEWEWVTLEQASLHTNGFLKKFTDVAGLYEDVTQNFSNEEIEIFTIDNNSEWAYVRTKADSYFGLVSMSNIVYPTIQLNSKCQVLKGHKYSDRNVRSFSGEFVSFEDSFDIEQDSKDWYIISDEFSVYPIYFVHKSALEPSNLSPLEWVKQFLTTPYLWGGRTAWGIDCSGLAQMYFRYQNIYIPRDADQQEEVFTKVEDPRAGDLAFFEGHVGILLEQNERGNWRMLHANSRHMSVTIDTLGEGEYGQYLSSILHGYGRWEGEIGVYWKPK